MKSKDTIKNGYGRLETLLLILIAVVLAGFLAGSRAMAQDKDAAGSESKSIFDDSDSGDAKSSADSKSGQAEDSFEEDEADDAKSKKKDDGILNEVRMSTDGTFELHIKNADLLDVLKHLSEQGRINIIVSKNITGKVTLDLFGVSLMEAIEAVLRSNNLCYRKEGNFVYVYTEKEYEEARKLAFKVFRLSYIQAEDAQKLVSAVLSDKGKITTTPPIRKGIVDVATDQADQGGGMSHAADEIIVVHDYEDNIKKVEEILKSIDILPQQVLLEATILSAELDEDTSLGVNIQALSGATMGAFNATTDLTGVTFEDAAVSGLSGNTQGRFNLPFDAQVADGATPMSVGFIYNNTAVFIQMLEQVTNTSIIANPKMLVVNKQRGDILIGTEEGYLTTEVSETFTSQKVEFLKTGTILQVRPFIGKDGFIRLEIHPEVSEGSVRILSNASEDSPALPTKKTTTITTNVIVRDGHTVVIGGLFRERIKTQRSQVPVLGDVPYVGTAFRRTYDTTVREEIIILITPHLIRHTKYEQFSEQIKDEVERFRVGTRKSIQWFTRSRIADTYINHAKQLIRENRKGTALWYLDLALSIEPQEESAVKLREEITGSPYWSSVPRFSATQQFIERAIMCDLGISPNSVQYPTKPLDVNLIPQKARSRLGIDPSLDKRLDALYVEKTYQGPSSDAVPQPMSDTQSVPPTTPVKKTSPAAGQRQTTSPINTSHVPTKAVSPATRTTVAAQPVVVTPRQTVRTVKAPLPARPVAAEVTSRSTVKTTKISDVSSHKSSYAGDVTARPAASKMESLMPSRRVKLETAPLMADPKPVSLQPEVKKLSTRPISDPKPQSLDTAKTPENGESKNWSVWVLWDEDTPLSKAE